MKTLTIKTALTLMIVCAMSSLALSQGPGAPPATPIDGGLSLLLAAGGLYGMKKLKDRNAH